MPFVPFSSDPIIVSRAVGCAGSVLVAVGGLTVGALPGGSEGADWSRSGLAAVYAGLALLVIGWWQYGQAGGTGRQAAATLAWWTAPMLLAPPMFSRDVYSYLAQGLIGAAGLDVYEHGPAALGGPVAAEVPPIWQDTPSPYGPAFQIVARVVTAFSDTHVMGGVVAMRLVALAGLALVVIAVPVLARAAGIPPVAALWLAVLNPLTLIHVVGGAHNDALMVGLLAVGLAAAVRNRPVAATALVAAAALVKAPAVLGLAAVAVIWAGRLPGRWAVLRTGLVVGAVAAGFTVVVTRVAGTGYGWVGALRTPISPENWSLTGVLGRWTASLTQDDVGAALAVDLWRWAGVLTTLIVAALVWTYRHRLGPVQGLGIVLMAVVAFGPALRPWYLLWGLIPLAVGAPQPRVRRALAVACVVLVPVVMPDGFAAGGEQILMAVVGALTAIAAYLAVTAMAPARLAVAR